MTTPHVPTFKVASRGLRAEISALGGQLIRLQDAEGRDLLWDGDPTYWTGRAPILFPIVGRLKDDHLTVEGKSYPMKQHGFARTSVFDRVGHEPDLCRLRLSSSAETRQVFPFDFSLDLTYRVTDETLEISADVRNAGTGPMPVSFGFHPAFRWPLPDGGERAAHQIRFEHEEPAPLHPLAGGLLLSSVVPSPVEGRILSLRDELFSNDALIFLAPHSRSVVYGSEGHSAIRVNFPDMPQLGLWSKPGAGFICIEPWCGHASPESFEGELAAKPGMVSIDEGAARLFSMRITLLTRMLEQVGG